MARKLQIIGSLLSGEIDSAKIKEIVDAYLQENPPSSGSDCVSPTITIEEIEGGHRVIITDVNGSKSFDVLDGENRTTPVEGVDYFTSLALAEKAAATAREVGSSDTVYYFGQKILVSENEVETWYVIERPGILVAENTGSENTVTLLVEGVNYAANNLSEPELSEDGEQYVLYLT